MYPLNDTTITCHLLTLLNHTWAEHQVKFSKNPQPSFGPPLDEVEKMATKKRLTKLKNILFFSKNKYAAPSNLLFDY